MISQTGHSSSSRCYLTLLVLAALAAAMLSLSDLARMAPAGQWGRAVFHPNLADIHQIIVYQTWLPRIAIALVCGAGLALAGAAMQQLLRNPLAEPMTLGTAGGAQLAVLAAAIWIPAWTAFGREWIALAGGAAATALVFALAWKQRLAPVSSVLAGMIVSLLCGSLATALTILGSEYLSGFFLWGAGSLTQNGWGVFIGLAPRLAVAALLLFATLRAIETLDIGDEAARSVGLSLRRTRLIALAITVAIASEITAAVGVIGFVGLAAPALARLGGARRLRDRFLWAPLVGAVLLWLTDEIAKRVAYSPDALPAGAITALIGAPVLLWLIPRMRFAFAPAALQPGRIERSTHPWRRIALIAALCVAAIALSLLVGRGASGWHVSSLSELGGLWPWRFPRIAAALGVGILLALSGCVLQRVTGNPMAGPDILGISTGAAAFVVAGYVLFGTAGRFVQIVWALLGAVSAIAAMLWLGRRNAYAPERMLLAGVAIGALFAGAVATFMATSLGSQLYALLDWLVGSLYNVSQTQALSTVAIAIAALLGTPFLLRWLDILPLGVPAAASIGVSISQTRLALMLFTAFTAAAATVIVGPLGFVGLMAPHMARLSGLRRASEQIAGGAMIGATTLILADWVGRNVIFPYQLPAGIVCAIVGAPYLLAVLWGRPVPFAILPVRFRRASAVARRVC
ncbi:MAG TPA: Fe(3+)-hydroxamate ABC transporter permease FhuB [Candidatus Cybelea sp.]|jgi:iron complex transport system permease protein|nr:Fe(3+)-hydroxamate ABC transporter permease FhuB [Candidatus Cybelea sp.]